MTELVSVAELQDPALLEERFESGKTPILWELPLPPHVDTEKIQVNFTRLNAIHRIGAFSGSIVDQHIGEVSEHFNVAGVNFDGSAVAGKSSSKQAPKSRSALIEYPLICAVTHENFGKPIVVHSINRPEAVQDVIELKEAQKTDEQAWAKVLDSSTRASFRAAGKEHLLNRPGLIEKALSYMMAGFVVNDVADLALNGNYDLFIPTYLAFYAYFLIHGTLHAKKYHGDSLINQYRWSMFLNNQPDRYMALNCLSRVPGLIRLAK